MATRRERVVLDLQDDFTADMLKAAGATALLNRELGRLDASSLAADRSTVRVIRNVDNLGKSAQRTDSQIDRLSGRVRILADVAAVLGPALAPIGSVALAGVAGLASQMGFAAVAGGVLAGSMQGVGTALEAMHKAQLEPTAENMEELRQVMGDLAPAAQDFAREAYAMLPALQGLRDAGATALFPGLTDSLNNMERLFPRVATIMDSVGGALGQIARDGSDSLASDRWADFFDFIATDAPSALSELARTVGSLTHGMAEMWMAFDPLNDDFSGWLEDVAAGFDDWASGLAGSQGFAEFVDYIRTTGPQVADTLGALANALVQIVQASAPLGGPVLAGIEAFAKAVGAIADSDLGTPIMTAVAAMGLLSRATATFGAVSRTSFGGFVGGQVKLSKSVGTLRSDLALMSREYGNAGRAQSVFMSSLSNTTGAAQRARTSIAQLAKGGALLAGVGVAATGAADGIGLTNTASLGLLGTMGGPWGAAVGAGAGFLMDVEKAADEAASGMDRFNAALGAGDTAGMESGIAQMQKRLDDLRGTDMASISFSSVGNLFSGTSVQDEIDQLESDLDEARQATIDLGDAQTKTALNNSYRRSIESETAALEHNIAAMRAKRDEALLAANAELAFESALLDTRDAARKYGNVLTKTGELTDGARRKGIEAKGELYNLAGAWNGLSDKAQAVPGAYRGAIRSFVDAAQKMGMSERAARDLARELLNIPAERTTRIRLDGAEAAIADADALERRLNAIADEDVFVNVRHREYGRGSMGPVGGVADGGTIPKTGLPYADRHLRVLADGEEVISNRHGQADRNRALLKAINAGRMANGGTVGPRNINVGAPSVNVGAPSVRVFIDGNEVRAIVRSEQAKANDFDRMMSRG